MNADRQNRVRQLFDAAMDRPKPERREFVSKACGDDAELRNEVVSLLGGGETTWLDSGVSAQLVRKAMQRDTLEGRCIGDFLIGDILGTGGMATVFAAEQQHPKRMVALKVMRFGFASEAARHRFNYESEILANLRHDGIAQVYATGTYKDDMSGHELPYFAMELVTGARTLIEYVEEEGLGLNATLCLFIDVCRAVQHGHQRGFLHRDLKPQNILVDNQGHPKIIDFGIARAVEPDREGNQMRTLAGEVLGTLHYMSPEQVLGNSPDLDIRSDVYSLGVILFELIAGRLPFDLAGASLTSAVETIRNADVPRPSTIDLRIPALNLAQDLDWVILTALEKDPDRRYDSVGDFADDINRMLADQAIHARPPSRAYLVSKFIKRHRAMVFSATLLFIVLITGVTATSINLVRAWNAEDEVQRTLVSVQLEADITQAVNEFLVSLFHSPDTSMDGRDVKVVDLLDKVAGNTDQLYADRPGLSVALKQSLASAYMGLGQNTQALELLERAVALGREHLATGHLQTVLAMRSLSRCYRSLNRLADSERVARKAYSLRSEAYGEQDLSTAGCLQMIALAVNAAGNLDEAASKMRKAHEINRDLKGPGYGTTVQTGAALGAILTNLGRYAEAETVLRSSLQHGKESLSADNTSTIAAAHNLGVLFFQQELFAEAYEVFQDVLAPYERVYGHNHSQTLSTVNNIAGSLKRLGRAAEAVEIYIDLIARHRAINKASPQWAVAYINLGASLESIDRLDEAEQAFGDAFAMLEQSHVPRRAFLTAVCRKGLAVVHTRQERFSEAESALEESIAVYIESQGDHSAAIRAAYEATVQLYEAWGKPDQAEAVRNKMASLAR